jgi:hypothetical protein
MLKTKAIELLGGTVTAAAEEIGITYQAVSDWPDTLSARISDRVYAALARKKERELIGTEGAPPVPTPAEQGAA